MSSKQEIIHPRSPRNKLGYTPRDYEGAMSTLCAGCGHDSITAGIVQAFFELDIEPHEVLKVSGIGCSSKTPTYFLSQAHGFNSVHGRMATIATGASAANGKLACIGISGDGDSLSIGIGHLCHAIRRNVNMLYIIENNGVYGLTKGQFSASADKGTNSKKGAVNVMEPIDSVNLALNLGASFVARSFSGDKSQLIPLLKAGLKHKGFVLLDVYSPCVTFNDHEGSTKSYKYTREHCLQVVHTDFIPPTEEITAQYPEGATTEIALHDGAKIRLHKLAKDYDPSSRARAMAYIRERQDQGEIVTGLLYCDPDSVDMHEREHTVEEPLNRYPYDKLCPGNKVLEEIQGFFT